MLTLIQISDLHFGPHFTPVAAEAFLRIAPELSADAAIITGDFTQRAKPGQFADARAFLDRMPGMPRVVMPGNHDVPLYRIWERLTDPYGLYRRHIADELNQVVHLDGAVIVALNSSSPRRAVVNGRIDVEQLALCERVFREAPPRALRIVAAHHHFTPAPDYERDQVMPKAKRAMDRFVDLGVDLVLGGHLHRAYIGNSLDIYRGARGDKGIVIVQCGTTTSRRGRAREREKNSFNLIRCASETIEVVHYLLIEDIGQFRPISRHVFPGRGRHSFTPD